jgi:2-hydroxy-3-keto-5-methylthiopentenyl-1-phosphate phosphatase
LPNPTLASTASNDPRPPLIAVDFDGTITMEDITNIIWDAHVPFDWREVLLPASRDGTMTPLELIANGYREVRLGPDALLAEVRPRAHLRAGFDKLVVQARVHRWPLHVISHGLGFYLRDLLPPGVSFTAFEGTFDGDHWQVALPPGLVLADGQDFKLQVLADLRARHPGRRTVYVGDGRLDFPAARRSDQVFAVRDSTLATLCRGARVACTEFDRFDEIVAALG